MHNYIWQNIKMRSESNRLAKLKVDGNRGRMKELRLCVERRGKETRRNVATEVMSGALKNI